MKLLYRALVAISIIAAVIAVVIMVMLRPPASSFKAEEDVWIVTSSEGKPIYALRFHGGLSECRWYLDHADQKSEQFRKDNPINTDLGPHSATMKCVHSATSPMIGTLGMD